MADHGCINESLDAANYSSPVPVIGLYIAAASAMCMLMMLWDIGAGIYEKKCWLPCKVFKLNSVTLFLLGVAAKLPVDLTSPMPSPEDQLSKLTGIVIICISMGFFVPSLGISNESAFTNLVALSLFVITVAANICIQLRTGVIVLFHMEHIILLVLMLVLLMLLWHTLLIIRNYKEITGDECKALLAEGNKSMLGRLKVCYLYSYCSSPQFTICKNPTYASISIGSLICSVVLMQAFFRSGVWKNLKFSSGDSDYGWSVPVIVVTQILTVVVGTFAIIYRWLALFRGMVFEKMIEPFHTDKYVTQRNQTLGKWHRLQKFMLSLILITSSTIQLVIVAPSVLLRMLFRLFKSDKLEHFDKDRVIKAQGYIVRRSVSDLMKLSDSFPKDSLSNLLQLLSDPAQKMYVSGNSYSAYSPRKKRGVCCMAVALLVKIGQVSIPEQHFRLIASASKEAIEILHFVDKTLHRRSSTTYSKLAYAKALGTDGDFSSLLVPEELGGIVSDFDRAVTIIERLEEKLQSDKLLGEEVGHMIEFIDPRSRGTIEELSFCMKQIFIDMVRESFSQLPSAIYTSLSEGLTEEFEGRLKLAMNYLFQTKFTSSLDVPIVWKFPPASDIVRLIDDDTCFSPMPTDPLEMFHGLIHASIERESLHQSPV